MWVWLLVALVVFIGATWVINYKRIKKAAAEEVKAPVEDKSASAPEPTPIVQDYSKLAPKPAATKKKSAKKRKPKKPAARA